MFCFVCSLALFFVVIAQAGTPLGTVRNSGSVKVSGTELQAAAVPSWPVAAGDEITTAAGSLAVISSARLGRLEIRENSHVTLGEDHVRLEKGVVASDRATVHFGTYSAQAKRQQGTGNWFVVAEQDGQVAVAAHRGDVLVTRAGATPLLVPAGSYALPAGPAPDEKKEKSEKEKKKKRKKRAGAATAGAAAGATILGMGATTAAVVGAAAVAAGVTTAAVTGDDETPTLTSRSPDGQ